MFRPVVWLKEIPSFFRFLFGRKHVNVNYVLGKIAHIQLELRDEIIELLKFEGSY